VSLVARLQSFTLATKTQRGAPAVTGSCLACGEDVAERQQRLRRPGTLKRRCNSFLPGGGQRRLPSVLWWILFADSGGRIVARGWDQPGDQPLRAGFWRQALTEEPNAPRSSFLVRYMLITRLGGRLPTAQIRPISPMVVLCLMLRCGTGDDRMAGAAWSVRMFGLQGRGVEIASSPPPA